jgi:hypothetical protein
MKSNPTTNNAEELVEIIDGKRYYQGKPLMPSQMIWRCTSPGCQTAPKPQRRGQYRDKLLCNTCSNREKSKNPAILEKRGKSISKAIKSLGSKWSDTAFINQSSPQTREKISKSMKEYVAQNADVALPIRRETAIKNNAVSGFGTSEFSKEVWSESSLAERQNRIEKVKTGLTISGKREHLELLHDRFPSIKLLEFGSPDNTYECEKKHVFFMRGNNLLKRGNCPTCTPKSQLQEYWHEWFKTLCPDALSNKRIFFLDDTKNGNKALEADSWSPEKNLAIEIHGLYCHTVDYVGNKHFIKAEIADKQGITLLQFFEDELNENPDIVKSIIKSKLGMREHSLYGRNCVAQVINKKDSEAFLGINHLQGGCRSFLRVGLYHEGELVSMMSFRKLRKKGGNISIAEIARYSSKINTSVVGGFSKLLKFSVPLLKKSGFTKIHTYSDRRYSHGEVYKANGFSFVHKTAPDMWWYKRGQRYPRQISWGKSVKQMTQEGYEKILGAGHTLWTMDL